MKDHTHRAASGASQSDAGQPVPNESEKPPTRSTEADRGRCERAPGSRSKRVHTATYTAEGKPLLTCPACLDRTPIDARLAHDLAVNEEHLNMYCNKCGAYYAVSFFAPLNIRIISTQRINNT